MHDEEFGRPAKMVIKWLALLPILFSLYALSIAPAFHLMSPQGFRSAYMPLIHLETHCPPLDRFLTWYMEDVWKCSTWWHLTVSVLVHEM
jgi:hypothetical protein